MGGSTVVGVSFLGIGSIPFPGNGVVGGSFAIACCAIGDAKALTTGAAGLYSSSRTVGTKASRCSTGTAGKTEAAGAGLTEASACGVGWGSAKTRANGSIGAGTFVGGVLVGPVLVGPVFDAGTDGGAWTAGGGVGMETSADAGSGGIGFGCWAVGAGWTGNTAWGTTGYVGGSLHWSIRANVVETSLAGIRPEEDAKPV